MNIHALKNIYDEGLKAAGVSKDSCLDLLDHKNENINVLYCADVDLGTSVFLFSSLFFWTVRRYSLFNF